MKKHLLLTSMAVVSLCAMAQNPYLPINEYIPDGEPYVFEDPDRPGEYRVYIYGSHDNLVTNYCGRDQVVWSAPVDDLQNWRYDGIIFQSIYGPDGRMLNADGKGDVLYAPDVALRVDSQGKKEYYLYPNNQSWGRNGMVAKSDRPDGPFTVINWSQDSPVKTDGPIQFDPAVFVDDDGRVYGYWGFERSYAAELDPQTMSSVKPGCNVIEDMVSNYKQSGDFRFFEASSMRKIDGKYVFVYSRITEPGEFGLHSTNYTLAYAYSDGPLGPWTYGGTIIDGRGRDTDDNGKAIYTACPYGNTHGSICQINGKWWLFYHRQTDDNEFMRQPVVAPINVTVEKGKGGKVTISEAEFTSEGFQTQGLNPFNKSLAAWACYYTQPDGAVQKWPNMVYSGSYVKTRRISMTEMPGTGNLKGFNSWMGNNTAGSVVGYKYYNFDAAGKCDKLSLTAHLMPLGVDGKIQILIGGPSQKRGGRVVGEISISKDSPKQIAEYTVALANTKGIKGKQPLFFAFVSETKGESICDFYDFQFFGKYGSDL